MPSTMTSCEFCGRPLFGVVAYCPYCGRQPVGGATAHRAKERAANDDVAAEAPVFIEPTLDASAPALSVSERPWRAPSTPATPAPVSTAPVSTAQVTGTPVTGAPVTEALGSTGPGPTQEVPMAQHGLRTAVRPSATPGSDVPAGAETSRRKQVVTAVVAACTVLLLALALKFFASSEPQEAAVHRPTATMGAPARIAPQPQAQSQSAPAPSPSRLLCSPADEAAGLCKAK